MHKRTYERLKKYRTNEPALIHLMSAYPNMEKSKEVALAYEIATKLDDLHSIDFHITCANNINEKTLREKLNYVLSKPGIDHPARYYTSSVKSLLKPYGKRNRY